MLKGMGYLAAISESLEKLWPRCREAVGAGWFLLHSEEASLSVTGSTYICIRIYTHICVCVCIYIYKIYTCFR